MSDPIWPEGIAAWQEEFAVLDPATTHKLANGQFPSSCCVGSDEMIMALAIALEQERGKGLR